MTNAARLQTGNCVATGRAIDAVIGLYPQFRMACSQGGVQPMNASADAAAPQPDGYAVTGSELDSFDNLVRE